MSLASRGGGGGQTDQKIDSKAKKGSNAKNIHEQPAMAGEVSDFTRQGEVVVGQYERLLNMKCANDEIKKMYQGHSQSDHGDLTYHGHSQSYHGDSGLDLFITKDTKVNPGETIKIGLGIQCAAQTNGVSDSWLIMPRSSMAKTPLRLANSIGLIDAGYRGEIGIMLDNIKKRSVYNKER